ncbi:LacI family DNA-binding transcriptional regulator [Xylanibacillus composti]|uniref:LacI family transcriptional regulator n=1 Tax=Xylanibacillus composti TaxID=1572762 RepID=A0A8J4M232_9BACL|nr:LacI family DNA-binding transcriptional regulator [Xylanibacillus composti]GIQ68091.1 LacI family transcriptional regulator [Xylanibacillus composti]
MRNVTIKEVAQAAGVSTATISRVLNKSGYVSEDVRHRVLETVRQLNYRPNAVARNLKRERTHCVGLILPDMRNPYFMRLAREVQALLSVRNYHILYTDSGADAARERSAINFMLENRIEALVIAGMGKNADKLREVQDRGVPLILIDRRVNNVESDIIIEDNRGAAERAVKLLVDKGHRKIGILCGPAGISTADERREGVQAALERAGLSPADMFWYSGDFSRSSGREAARQMHRLLEPPTAVFSANNEMTFGLYLGLKEMGQPLDFWEVASYGELEFAPLFANRLAYVRQNPEALGRTAAELVLERIGGADRGIGLLEQIVLTPDIVCM